MVSKNFWDKIKTQTTAHEIILFLYKEKKCLKNIFNNNFEQKIVLKSRHKFNWKYNIKRCFVLLTFTYSLMINNCLRGGDFSFLFCWLFYVQKCLPNKKFIHFAIHLIIHSKERDINYAGNFSNFPWKDEK